MVIGAIFGRKEASFETSPKEAAARNQNLRFQGLGVRELVPFTIPKSYKMSIGWLSKKFVVVFSSIGGVWNICENEGLEDGSSFGEEGWRAIAACRRFNTYRSHLYPWELLQSGEINRTDSKPGHSSKCAWWSEGQHGTLKTLASYIPDVIFPQLIPDQGGEFFDYFFQSWFHGSRSINQDTNVIFQNDTKQSTTSCIKKKKHPTNICP